MTQQKQQEGITVFFSYAQADQAVRNQLATHLSQLKRGGLIEEWSNQQILAGSDRVQAIDQAIHSAQIILLLISPDFLASDYCYDIEMQQAFERHKLGDVRVIPIILRPCDWQYSPLKDLQCLPHGGKPVTEWENTDAAFLDITKGLRRVIEQRKTLAHPPVRLSQLGRQNRMRMLRQVQRMWIDGLLKKSLHDVARIELCLQDRPDVLANPWQLQVQELDQAPETLPGGTTIIQVYDKAEGELLILGEPGAGKTTLLLELTRTLLERAEKDEQLPMSIVFTLSSWAQKRQSLDMWLIEELWTRYQVPRKIGRGWIDADQVLPLLDGLDEVAKEARIACVQAINNYYQSRLEHGSSPIVVCCRSEEYTALSTRVKLQHAVSILPLMNEQINTYLEQAGEPVKGLRQALNEDAELHGLVRQPLMLNIFTLAYQGAAAMEVPTGETGDGARHTIFTQYLERMLKRREQSKHWKPEQVIRWLTFLAKQMQLHNQTIFFVENLQPTWLDNRRVRILYQSVVSLLIGLLLVLGLFPVAIISSSSWSIVIGLLGGLLIVFFQNRKIDLIEAPTWTWRGLRLGIIVGSFVGIVTMILIAYIIWLGHGEVDIGIGAFLPSLRPRIVSGIISGGVIGFLVGLIIVLVGGFSSTKFDEQYRSKPNQGVWRSARNGGLFAGIALLVNCMLLILLSFFLAAGWGYFGDTPPSYFTSMEHVLTIFIYLGFIIVQITILTVPFVGLRMGGMAAIQHIVLRLFLWRSKSVPWKYIQFLDYAAERILLRKVGGGYIFVHRQLLDYFATLDEPASAINT